ncbi:hypothetical protein EDB80DRAFT_724497 [Ilyonectria destructans]|nr:hypothetical protein EDB80DRAFT_724497 [Ilyonectria destructans]
MDPVTALGASAAAAQFGVYGVKGLIGLISLVGQLREAPPRIRELLQDVQRSVTDLDQLRKVFQGPNSDIAQGLEPRQVQSIQRILDDSHDAMRKLQDGLKSLVTRKHGTMAAGTAKAWKAVVSVPKMKEIEEKLRRIQRLHSDVLLQLQVTDVELQIKLSATFAGISRSVDETRQDIQLLSRSTAPQMQLTDDKLSTIELRTDSILAGEMRIESSLSTMQPTLMSLQQGQKVMHEGIGNIDKTLGTLSDNISTSRELLLALTNHQHQFRLHKNTTQLSSADKADIINQITTGLVNSPSTLRDAFQKKPVKKARKYSINLGIIHRRFCQNCLYK